MLLTWLWYIRYNNVSFFLYGSYIFHHWFSVSSLFDKNALKLCELRMTYESEKWLWFEFDLVIDFLYWEFWLCAIKILLLWCSCWAFRGFQFENAWNVNHIEKWSGCSDKTSIDNILLHKSNGCWEIMLIGWVSVELWYGDHRCFQIVSILYSLCNDFLEI